ncbi:PR5K-like protein [Mya arenaria]|uniref:PR5K-like protein n=1 Tax=Mya arenaria TaxID=6604 RepID=A0ABY7EMW4_MYAAR|nr:PR5K-like protein [Mya arenaria]
MTNGAIFFEDIVLLLYRDATEIHRNLGIFRSSQTPRLTWSSERITGGGEAARLAREHRRFKRCRWFATSAITVYSASTVTSFTAVSVAVCAAPDTTRPFIRYNTTNVGCCYLAKVTYSVVWAQALCVVWAQALCVVWAQALCVVWAQALCVVWAQALCVVWAQALCVVWAQALCVVWAQALCVVWAQALCVVWAQALCVVWAQALCVVWAQALCVVWTQALCVVWAQALCVVWAQALCVVWAQALCVVWAQALCVVWAQALCVVWAQALCVVWAQALCVVWAQALCVVWAQALCVVWAQALCVVWAQALCVVWAQAMCVVWAQALCVVWTQALLCTFTSNGFCGGFKLPAYQSHVMNVPFNWAGRVWGRTHCSGNTCLTGNCQHNGLHCNRVGPETLTTFAEITLDHGGNKNQDFYHITCPNAFSYKYDDYMSTFTCNGLAPEQTSYDITFCG